MLTKTDLKNLAQQTREVIQEETPRIVESIVRRDVPSMIKQVVSDELKPIKRKINKIAKTLDVGFRLLDEDQTKLRKRVDRIELQLEH